MRKKFHYVWELNLGWVLSWNIR